jgi:hypothetical protein
MNVSAPMSRGQGNCAAWQALRIARASGRRSRAAIGSWIFVVLGVISAAAFWRWLIHLDLFI